METLNVVAARDTLEKIARCSPLKALEEIVWNALDADANRVDVSIVKNGLDGIERIVVEDDGHGMDLLTARTAFSHLGGSPKLHETSTKKGRLLHGKEGRGRYRALALGATCRWQSRCATLDGGVEQFQVLLGVDGLSTPSISAPETTDEPTGCTVTVEDVFLGSSELLGEELAWELGARFAQYLLRNPGVQIVVNGVVVDPSVAIDGRREFDIKVETSEETALAKVVVYFWNGGKLNEMFLCTEQGVAIQQTKAGVREPSLSFSAYVQSQYFTERWADGVIQFGGLDQLGEKLRERARYCLRQAIREVLAARAAETVSQLEAEDSYPYSGEPKDELERAERQVFDIAAQKLYELSPSLQEGDPAERKLKMRILASAIEQAPSARDRIINKVFELTTEKQEELAALLDRVELSRVVSLASEVVGRIDFLNALHILVYQAEARKKLKERLQLHKILLRGLWLFGEQYHLGTSDSTLRNVLKEHLRILGREELAWEGEVPDDLRMDRIPDLMLYSQLPVGRPGEYDHLVVELKRPSVKVGRDEAFQITDYARAVAEHPGFNKDKTRWRFVVVSSQVNETELGQWTQQKNRPHGLLLEQDSYTVWAYEWGTLIQDARHRMEHLKNALKYDVRDDEAALAYMRENFGDLIPDHLRGEGQGRSGQGVSE